MDTTRTFIDDGQTLEKRISSSTSKRSIIIPNYSRKKRSTEESCDLDVMDQDPRTYVDDGADLASRMPSALHDCEHEAPLESEERTKAKEAANEVLEDIHVKVKEMKIVERAVIYRFKPKEKTI